jgi:hypothetical protein
VIPYIAVHLRDLQYVKDGNPDALNDTPNVSSASASQSTPLVNFQKVRLLWKTVEDIQRYKPSVFEIAEQTATQEKILGKIFSPSLSFTNLFLPQPFAFRHLTFG